MDLVAIHLIKIVSIAKVGDARFLSGSLGGDLRK